MITELPSWVNRFLLAPAEGAGTFACKAGSYEGPNP
jgi:hypothetical protein